MVSARFIIGRRKKRASSSSADNPTASWETSRKGGARGSSWMRRVLLSFALTALLTVFVLVVVLAVVWEGEFRSHARANMERVATQTAKSIASGYERDLRWSMFVLVRAACIADALSGVGVQVLDASGSVVYDNSGPSILANKNFLMRNEKLRYSVPPVNSNAIITVPVTLSDGRVVGSVRMWALDSDVLLTKAEAALRTSSYLAIAIAAFIAVILATIFGWFASRSLSRPIQRIASTADQIRHGDLTARTGLTSNDAIGQLAQTFDHMAATIERDLKLERRLTSDVAHELRTPLMAMLATVEAMQDGVMPCDSERLATISDEVRRLSRLVDAMLQLSRLESGVTPFHPKPTEIVALVSGIVLAQEQLFAEQGLKLRFDCDIPGGKCYAEVDRDMIRQAVVNLMSNAMRYTPKDGWVVVKVSQEKQDVLISVCDTGIGIAREDISRVFARFWRSDASRQRAAGGLGVGLSVTKEIIDRHHGNISVESQLGQGTMFVLRIPLEQEHVGHSENSATSDLFASKNLPSDHLLSDYSPSDESPFNEPNENK